MMYPFMTLNDDTEITHSEMKIDGTVKVYIETPNDTGRFHHATCWLPEYKWQDIKGYSNLEIAYFKNYIASVSHIIMELSRTGGFNALYEKASPDLESLKNYQIDNPKYPTRIAQTELSKEHSYTTQDIDALPEGKRAELSMVKFIIWYHQIIYINILLWNYPERFTNTSETIIMILRYFRHLLPYDSTLMIKLMSNLISLFCVTRRKYPKEVLKVHRILLLKLCLLLHKNVTMASSFLNIVMPVFANTGS